MPRSLYLVVTTTALLMSSAGGAVEPLQATGKWDLDYGETQCIASRPYGSASGPVTLAIRQSPNGESYEILVGRKFGVKERATEEKATVDFGNGPIKAWGLFYQTPQQTFDVHEFRVSAAEMSEARSASSVTLRFGNSLDVAFRLALIPELLDGLQACTADLKRYWNMDGEKTGKFSKESRGDLRSIFSSGDYPSEAVDRSQEGKGLYLLLIDEKGKVAGCQVLTATGVPILDAMGCAVIQKRAQFSPARDKSGKPVRSTVITPPIVWRLG